MSDAAQRSPSADSLPDFSVRATLVDALMGMAAKAFFMVVGEIERTGNIASPFMMTVGADGFDIGRICTDRAVVMLQDNVGARRRPGVVAFTESSTLVLVAVDTHGVLFRVEVPFALSGRRFEEPVPAHLTEVFDDRYTTERAMKHLLPLRGATGEGGEVDPEAVPTAFLPNPADAVADMVRLSELSALRPQPTLDGLEERRHAEASQGLLACWNELSTTLDKADAAAFERYQERLLAAQTPLLRLLAAGTDFSDDRVRTDAEYQVRVLGSLRAAFDFVDDGAAARQELVTVFGEVLQPLDSKAERAIRKVANKLSLVASMARMLRTTVLVVGVALALLGGMTVALLWLLR